MVLDDADLCVLLAGAMGKLWKRHRRAMPPSVRQSWADTLLALRLIILPDKFLDASSSIGRARYDIRGVSELLKYIASRDQSLASSMTTSAPSGSFPCGQDSALPALNLDSRCTSFTFNPQASDFLPGKKTILLGELVPESRHRAWDVEVAADRCSDAHAHLGHAQCLIDCQNNTIGFLVSQLDLIAEDAVHDSIVCRLKSIENSLEQLRLLSDGPPAKRTRRSDGPRVFPNRRTDSALPAECLDTSECVEKSDTMQAELEKASQIISDLRQQNAAQAAIAARRDEVAQRGRLLQSVAIPSGAMDSCFPIGDTFLKYAGSATELDIREPYLVSQWQIQNFVSLLGALVSHSHVRAVRLWTHTRSQPNDDTLRDIACKFKEMGVSVSIMYQHDLHVRELLYSNGIAILSDRGLDIFRAPSAKGVRYCRNVSIHYYEVDDKVVVKTANVAASLASEARGLLVGEVTQDLLKIEALVIDSKNKRDEEHSARRVRQSLEGTKAKQLIDAAGYRFSPECVEAAKKDGFSCAAAYFAANIDIFDEQKLMRGIKQFVSFKWLEHKQAIMEEF